MGFDRTPRTPLAAGLLYISNRCKPCRTGQWAAFVIWVNCAIYAVFELSRSDDHSSTTKLQCRVSLDALIRYLCTYIVEIISGYSCSKIDLSDGWSLTLPSKVIHSDRNRTAVDQWVRQSICAEHSYMIPCGNCKVCRVIVANDNEHNPSLWASLYCWRPSSRSAVVKFSTPPLAKHRVGKVHLYPYWEGTILISSCACTQGFVSRQAPTRCSIAV